MRLVEFRVIALVFLAPALIPFLNSQAFSHDWRPTTLAKGAQRRDVQVPIPSFTLTDHTGKVFHFESLRGKVVLLAFVYTTCPDVCPLVTASMRSVQRSLEESEQKDVFLLSITTDPEVDSPAVLKSYAQRYQVDFRNWLFLTGDQKSLDPVWKSFGIKVERKARGLVNHTTLTALVDQKGVMRFVYYGTYSDHKSLLRDFRSLVREP